MREKQCSDASTKINLEPFSYTIPYVDPDIVGNRVGEFNTLQFIWRQPEDGEYLLVAATPMVDTTNMSIVNAAIDAPPGSSCIFREHWGCGQEPDGDGGPYARSVTPILDNNTAAGWVKAAVK
jgi:hypothetical protein